MQTKHHIGGLVSALAVAAASAASAQPVAGHEHLLPERNDAPGTRDRSWRAEGSWRVAPADRPGALGSRVAALFEVRDDGPPVAMEARGVSEHERGPWLALEETFRGDTSRVAVVDLHEEWPAAEIRLASAEDERVGDLAWELLEPLYPDAGESARRAAERQTLQQEGALDPELAEIGVVSRAEWGARPTACSATEDNWYRMAIHHTAGAQTSGGSVADEVQAIQAYHQDSGTWCDIAYQFLVGYDGSLFQGRPLYLRSGATGGNNDGNMAISFVGCYHPSGCPAGSHSVTDAMIDAGRQLIQTASRLHDIPVDDSSILGHRDHGNATACPGDFLHDRLDDLRRDDQPAYAARIVARSEKLAEGSLDLELGETETLWVEFENAGTEGWEPDVTYLAPTAPRDAESPLSHGSWPSPERAATVDEAVPPGETARFSFQVHGDSPGEIDERFTLVQEGVTWFPDEPLGDDSDDSVLALHVNVEDASGDPRGEPDDEESGEGAVTGGCHAGAGSPSGPAALALVVAAVFGMRRRARRPV